MTDEVRPAEREPAPSWWPYACGAVAIVAVFNAFWALGVADWKTDEAWDGRLAWLAVDGGDWAQDNGHPVFVRWFLGASQLAFGQTRFAIRFAPALASVAAVGLLYLVGKRLHSRGAGLVAAALWAVLPRTLVVGSTVVAPLRGDRFGYLEPFMVVALLGATWTAWNWIESGRLRDAVGTGLLVGTAAAFKPTAVVVLVPIVVLAVWVRRSVAPLVGGIAVMAVLALAILPLSYLPLGTDAPGHLRTLIDYQLDHARTGHRLVVDGALIEHQSRTSHLGYQWRGMGWAACTGLLIGIIGAWSAGRSRAIALVSGIWLTLLAFHLLSSVALPHYYVLWAPFSVLLAAMGLVELARLGAPVPVPVPAASNGGGPMNRAAATAGAATPLPMSRTDARSTALAGPGDRFHHVPR